MKVKELRDYLNGIDDDTEVKISTEKGTAYCIGVIHHILGFKQLELRAWEEGE